MLLNPNQLVNQLPGELSSGEWSELVGRNSPRSGGHPQRGWQRCDDGRRSTVAAGHSPTKAESASDKGVEL